MTPRHDWTWSGGNFRFAASLRWYCSRICACWDNPYHDNITTNFWQVLENLQIMDQDRALYLISKATDSRTELLPPQNGHGSPSGSCGPTGDSFCPLDWDTKHWGPLPYAPVGASDIIPPQAPSTNISVCGNKCHRPSDCGATSDKYTCSCALPTITDIRTLGLDPIAPVAICIALFAASSKMKQGPGGSLNGRDSQQEQVLTDWFQVPHSCRCNETVIADECCVVNTRPRRAVNVLPADLHTRDTARSPRQQHRSVERNVVAQRRVRR